MDLTKLLRPIKTDKIRLGPNRDGGYVVAKNYLSTCLYTYGIGTHCGFEEDYNILMPSCNIYLFDGTIESPDYFLSKHKNAKFFKKNIGPVHYINSPYDKELDIKEENVFVQMDIEGNEIDIFNDMSESTIQKIKQLCLEVHIWDTRKFSDVANFFKKLNQYFYLVHVHGNNFNQNTVYSLPQVIELTYVNKLHWTESLTLEEKSYPIQGLDFPNDPNTKDLILDWWIN